MRQMSYILQAVKDKPVAIWALDSASPFVDYSGYARAGSSSGAADTSIALVSGAAYSTVFSGTVVGQFDSPVFKQGLEANPFSLEVSFYVGDDGSTGEQLVLGHTGAFDGITVSGTKVSFSTKYLTAGEARAEFDLQTPRAVHAVGVHSSDKNSLYIDDVLVAEVEISNAQMNDSYVATDGKLYSGESTSTKSIAVNGIAIYDYALNAETISSHFSAARRVVPEAYNMYGGHSIKLSKGDTLLKERVWSSDTEWSQGVFRGLTLDNGELVPQIINDTSVPGEWLSSCDLYDAGTANPLNSVNINWDGEGVVVEASLDAVTWTPVVRGRNLSIIPVGFDPTQKELSVRVSFPGGAVDDDSYITSLVVRVFGTNTVAVDDNRTLTYTQPAHIHNEYPSTQLSDDWGVELTGGNISVSSSTTSIKPKTVEIWAKRTGTYSTNMSAGTTYTNGVTGSSTKVGQWNITHFALPTFGEPLTISGNAVIGRVVIYPDELTAAQISNLYKSYTGVPSVRVGDNSIVAVAESPEASKIYAHDWSIEAAG